MSALTDARAYVGGLSAPSKMPCHSYNLPAHKCNVGSRLAKLYGSVCSDCYALKGRYLFPIVQRALERRLATIRKKNWASNMARSINNAPFFRWHDSGDIQSLRHLHNIVDVANSTPDTLHWLPTREGKIVRDFLRNQSAPSNLVIRVSGAMIDGPRPKHFAHTSTVHDRTIPTDSHVCPASTQGNQCGDCRACWSQDVGNVSYPHH